jgi:hypothetical protein
MQIRYKETGELDHVSSEVGRFAIKTGVAEEVLPTPKASDVITTNWVAKEGRYVSIDYQFPPHVAWSCGKCGQWQAGPNLNVARHCGVVDYIPSHIKSEYERLLADYKGRSRKKPQPAKVDSHTTDPRQLSYFGIKTKEQLALQMQADILAAKVRR